MVLFLYVCSCFFKAMPATSAIRLMTIDSALLSQAVNHAADLIEAPGCVDLSTLSSTMLADLIAGGEVQCKRALWPALKVRP